MSYGDTIAVPKSSPALTITLHRAYDEWHANHRLQDAPREGMLRPWHWLVREHLGAVEGRRILEVACGQGGFARELQHLGAQVTGCDFSAVALRLARRVLETSSTRAASWLIQGDIQQLPFADGAFDAVVDCETIEHVPNDQQALREMYRVTRPGGTLFLTTPNYLNLTGAYNLYSRIRQNQSRTGQPLDRSQWFVSVRRHIQRAGWTILKTDGTVHQFPLLPGRNPLRWQALESCRVIRRLLSPFALHFFVMAKKLPDQK